MDQTITAQPKVIRKTFTYHTNLTWLEKKSGTLSAEGKPSLKVASPLEFKGEAAVWTPEDLFVASVEICTMATFMAFAQRLQLPVVSYKSNAGGLLEFIDGGYRFTKIVLKPEIIVRTEEAVEQTHRTLDDAHDGCLIANSISAEVVVEPVVRVLNAEEK
jgi:organic hydroperoxide reductase OsmC/OhrA